MLSGDVFRKEYVITETSSSATLISCQSIGFSTGSPEPGESKNTSGNVPFFTPNKRAPTDVLELVEPAGMLLTDPWDLRIDHYLNKTLSNTGENLMFVWVTIRRRQIFQFYTRICFPPSIDNYSCTSHDTRPAPHPDRCERVIDLAVFRVVRLLRRGNSLY
jgi:hypothetical protein